MLITGLTQRSKESLQVLMDDSVSEEMQRRTQSAIREINVQLEDLLDQAPSDAVAELQVRKVHDAYKGFLKLTSRQRRFIGASVGSDLTDVFFCLFREVWTQIHEWKQDRNLHLN